VPDDPEGTAAIYRYWASLHHQLVPFFYSLAEEAYAGGPVILQPLGDEQSWAGDYRYLLGEAFLVAPLLDASGVRDVELSEGSWYDWWTPDAPALVGPTTVTAYDATDPLHVPLFVREGAIIPLVDANEATGLGTAATRDRLTVLVYPGPASTFELHEDDGVVTTIEQSDAPAVSVSLSRVRADTWLRVRLDAAPASVVSETALMEYADRAALDGAASGWFYEPYALWIKLDAAPDGRSVSITP
jgi:alpha-D-xyloside xylohydrolase